MEPVRLSAAPGYQQRDGRLREAPATRSPSPYRRRGTLGPGPLGHTARNTLRFNTNARPCPVEANRSASGII
ncbi:hypothetical protein GA0115240_15478 [Streptomyces sp. DvalAA-14]|nr:hypothetical protein GA0115240_15478 [Streptomyces sp. DvalAA-14]